MCIAPRCPFNTKVVYARMMNPSGTTPMTWRDRGGMALDRGTGAMEINRNLENAPLHMLKRMRRSWLTQ